MAFAQGSRSTLAFIEEATFGVTPTTPTLAYLPYKTHSLALTKERLEGADMLGDRMPRIDRHGNKQAGGSFEVDLRQGDFDAFLESAFFSTFTEGATVGVDDTLKIGTTPKYFSIEDSAEDISQHRLYTGMAVSTASFNIAPNQMVQTTFDLIGKAGGISGTSASTGGAKTPNLNNSPFDSYNGTLNEGGSPIAIVSSIDFSVSNSLAPTFVVGSDEAPQLEYGRAVVEGSVTVYYEDATLINKFLNETESSLQVSVGSPAGGDTYTFSFPRVKYNGATTSVANPQSRFIELPFVSLYDPTEETNFKLVRSL
jgi:hypothetical protein